MKRPDTSLFIRLPVSSHNPLAGQEGLEPPALGFGDRRSTIRATGLYIVGAYSNTPLPLFCFLMNSVSPAMGTEFLKLQFVRSRFFVLCCRIILPLARGTSKANYISHFHLL